jgi:hypothetical protein
VLLFFGRFIHDNYIGTLLATAVLGQVLRDREKAAAGGVSAGDAAR